MHLSVIKTREKLHLPIDVFADGDVRAGRSGKTAAYGTRGNVRGSS